MPSLEDELDRTEYPFRSQYEEIGDQSMHLIDEGDGDPVVMVHGNPTWSWYYRRLAADLRENHRVIVPDHIGCGLSSKPGAGEYPFTLARRIEDLETLLERRGVTERVTWVVHDWGGAIGLGVATKIPERVRRVIILNTSAFGLPEGKKFPFLLWWIRHTPLGPFLVQGLNAFVRGTLQIGCHLQKITPEARRGYLAPYHDWASRLAVLRFVQDIPRRFKDPSWDTLIEVERRLSRLHEVPVQLFWGDRDPVFDRAFRLSWKKRYPDQETHLFPGGGHLILEDAYETILPHIRRFLGDEGDFWKPGTMEVHE